MKQKIEYQINKHTPLVEELINIENSISNVFDGYSEIYKQYKQKFTEACNVKDVTIINQSQESESLEEDIDSTLAARERRDRIEYLKNQIKEETKDWQTKFGDKGSVDIFKENDKKIRYAISPFIRHDDGESLDVIEKTFKEIIRKTNKYFNLEGIEKFRLKLNPMFVTIICP